ncbi:DNA methyltransferase Dim-2 [Didymella keratinophila]|nr:DNA methyltransferase Dim-2 [Didymella keratinophila]
MPAADTQKHQTGQGSPTGNTRRANVRVRPSSSDYPRSYTANYTRPAPITTEEDLIKSLKHDWKERCGNEPTRQTSRQRRESIVADIQDFEIYRCPETDLKRPSELTSLHLFDVKAKNLCLDGYVRVGKTEYYVERLQVNDISIGGYGDDTDPGIVTYVQTRLANNDVTSDIWLRLQYPAPRYERFNTPFLWVAALGKHALDYMDIEPKGTVSLESFENEFGRWLAHRFGVNTAFREWHAMIGHVSDFRVAFNAYAEFFYVQACNLSTRRHLVSHPIWAHCKVDRLVAIDRQPNRAKDTLATSHVFESFRQMYFARKLKEIILAPGIRNAQRKRKMRLGFAEDHVGPGPLKRNEKGSIVRGEHNFKVGDVVSILPDESDKVNWQEAGDEWLAYIQGVEPARGRSQRLSVLWLYRAADTNMCLAQYNRSDELFLSDNCNCGERETLSTDAVRKYTVEWSPRSLDTVSDYFVRQMYITRDSAFVTIKNEHKTCSCRKPAPSVMHWSRGDTVYITKTTDDQKTLEPVVIHEIDYAMKEVNVRALLRLGQDCSDLALQAGRTKIAPNELVLTGKLKVLPISRIQRACHVLFVQMPKLLAEEVPFPYNLRGAGDYWFISMGLDSSDGTQRLVSLDGLPKGFHQAQTQPLPYNKLRGLSLFSGGGGLDRGLEDL